MEQAATSANVDMDYSLFLPALRPNEKMDWKFFLIGVGLLTLAYWSYRDVKGKLFLDDDSTPSYNFGKDWIWAIGGSIIGLLFILKSVPIGTATIIVLCIVLCILFFIFRWLFKILRR